MWFIVLEYNIVDAKIVNFRHFASEPQQWKGVRLPFQLLVHLIHMVVVNVCIAQRVNKITGIQPAHVGNHVRQQSVAGNIEWYTESHVGAALVHLARQLSVGHVKLDKTMARRQDHLRNVHGVPCGHHDAPVVWRFANTRNALGQLIDALAWTRENKENVIDAKWLDYSTHTCVGVGTGFVRGTVVTPLKTVHRTQITRASAGESTAVEKFAARVAIPYVHVATLQFGGISAAPNEPQQFLDYRTPSDFFRRQHRYGATAQRKSHLCPKHGPRAHTRSIGTQRAEFENFPNEAQILVFVVSSFIVGLKCLRVGIHMARLCGHRVAARDAMWGPIARDPTFIPQTAKKYISVINMYGAKN